MSRPSAREAQERSEMKRMFTMLKDARFTLKNNEVRRFMTAPDPGSVRLNREGFELDPAVKKKAKVFPFMYLGTHPDPGKGDLFSPIFGEVTDVTERSVFITAAEPDDELRARAAAVEKADVRALPEGGEELCLALKKLGLNTKSLAQPCETLIINGLNPDPGVTWAEPMINSHPRHFLLGMKMLKRISPAKRIVLAIPKGLTFDYPGIETAEVPFQYPASVNALVVRAVTGREKPEGVGVVGLHNIWSLGHVLQTRLPLVDTVITIGTLKNNGNFIVRDGSTVGDLLDFAGIELKEGDTVVRGGPLRGESLDRYDRSITKGSVGLFIVEQGTIAPMEGHSPCIECGSCSAICPARLRPDMLSRYAEFGLHERCLEEYITSCLECGLCGYVCIARRPVLQYIRLAKRRLGLKLLSSSGLYSEKASATEVRS